MPNCCVLARKKRDGTAGSYLDGTGITAARNLPAMDIIFPGTKIDPRRAGLFIFTDRRRHEGDSDSAISRSKEHSKHRVD